MLTNLMGESFHNVCLYQIITLNAFNMYNFIFQLYLSTSRKKIPTEYSIPCDLF